MVCLLPSIKQQQQDEDCLCMLKEELGLKGVWFEPFNRGCLHNQNISVIVNVIDGGRRNGLRAL